jgi:hypothetical protein
MAKIAQTSTKPSAWIVSPKDRGRKPIKSGNIFLNDKEEFEIELFNPLTVSVLADIKLNGQSISKTGLVLKPGQRFYLDCFVDDKKKFIFSTYEIDGGQESLDATQNNGLLEVFFYKEDIITLDNWKNKMDKVIIERYYPVYYPTYKPYPWNNIYCGGSFGGEYGTTNCIIGNTTTTNVDLSNLNIGGSINMTPINSSYTSNSSDLFTTPISANMMSDLETGRVERGSSSSQKFTEIEMDFEKNYISSTIIQILPESRKPAEVKNVKINIELPKGDWSKKQIEEAKEVVQNFLWKEDTQETQKEMYKNIELIKKLADLHSAGILTDAEFNTKKSELLSKI